MKNNWTRSTFLRSVAGAALLALALSGCGSDGSDGAPGAPGKDADPAVSDSLQQQIDNIVQQTAANPETCVTCHVGSDPVARSGPMHQARYAEFYQDGVVKVVASSMALAANGTDATTLTFKMTKNGAPFDCTKKDAFAIGSYWAKYEVATKTFSSDVSLKGNVAWDAATNVCTITKTYTSDADKASVAAIAAKANAIVQIYGTDEILETNPEKHITSGKYPFAGVMNIGTVDYSTAANVSGCENCHTRPFLKHTYIYGEVKENYTGQVTEFYTCKGCHYDERNGGHVDWQILYDDPDRYAEIVNGSPITDAEKAKYAYKAKLMNDVHMSHNMEFAYPQSMKNCVTCHKSKLDKALADSQFTKATCKSCHAIDNLGARMAAADFSHSTLIPQLPGLGEPATACTQCHVTGGAAPSIAKIHNGGYDPKIYTSTGVRYSDSFVVKVDSTSKAGNTLTVKFSATGPTTIPGIAGPSAIVPTVMIGLYGYDSKDFIVKAHDRDANRVRLLEYKWGDANPRFTPVSAANGSWEVRVDLSMWADQIASGVIRRAEVAVMPELTDATGLVLGLNAPSRTFDITKNAFDDTYFKDIVDVKGGCNTCHDQLATTFHSGIRGGNIKVCRICHEVGSGGSHLELQSRSIDSYVHAIHSFQAFDPGDIDFGDPAESVAYQHHINSEFPRFGILNCESCHGKGNTPNVPNQAKSMPGILSGTDTVEGRNIGMIPPTVTGPAVRACGACHRAQRINADDATGLAVLTQHWKTFGYSIEAKDGDEAEMIWEKVVAKLMTIFK